ncbi:MAG: sodium/proton antiporter NhaB [Betaproteobacteria bacterium]|nr:sodium/proton antiporter NhaB [Betaproteobacteria bacterium]
MDTPSKSSTTPNVSRSVYLTNFLQGTPNWYKAAIIAFLIINPILFHTVGPFVTGWVLILEFIFTLAMALKAYPLAPGGLLAIEAVAIGMTSPATVYHEIVLNFPVILLLMFMVAGIYFMKGLLLFLFTKVLINVRSKIVLSLLFSLMAAFLSAFLDALTVTAVIIAVAVGFYGIYHKVASGKTINDTVDIADDQNIQEIHRDKLDQFKSFLRSLMMHGAVGTALGGVCTLVGEPQNLLIAERANWEFIEFFIRMSPVTMPVLVIGLMTCAFVEKFKILGYGAKIPSEVLDVLIDFDKQEEAKRTPQDKAKLTIQAIAGVWLMIALGMHLAEVGVIGLSVIIFITAFNGVIKEHDIGYAFTEALPFTALLVVFFAIVAVIQDQNLFAGIIHYGLALEGVEQIGLFYVANGLLSAISDNVFVATVYINELAKALAEGIISRDQFDLLAVAVNTGTNIPSVATPNGQAAFLFLLTSAIAPLIQLSYGRMVLMALPYTITMAITGFLTVTMWLPAMTETLYERGLINHHEASEIGGHGDNATSHH